MIVQTDYENNNEEFWLEISARAENNDEFAKTILNHDKFLLADNEEIAFRECVEDIDGWFDGNAVIYAKHPLLISEIWSLDFRLNLFDDNGKIFLQAGTKRSEIPNQAQIEWILFGATGRNWKASASWHPTFDSDEVYCEVSLIGF